MKKKYFKLPKLNLCQTQKNIEIVIIDSFSKDKLLVLLKYLKIKKEKY